MKNTIMYHYNFDNLSIYRWKEKTFIKYKNEIYLFQIIYNEKETMEIYYLLKDNPNYYEFILNIMGTIFTIYNGQKYVLLKRKNSSTNYEQEILKRIYIPNNKYIIDRSNWYLLWTKKNDYFEYQLNHIYGKYPFIDESIDYFIGMAETAISYISYNSIENRESIENLVLCHKRVSEEEFFNPLNVVIDYKERDIAEYLKYLFFTNQYSEKALSVIINGANCTKRGYHRLYGRLLYPSYYFDLYEEIVNGNKAEQEMKRVIGRIEEYERFLVKIYQLISRKVDLKKVGWIEKM